MGKISKEELIDAICEALDGDEVPLGNGYSLSYYPDGNNYFSGSFSLYKEDGDSDEETEMDEEISLDYYWNTYSELMTLGEQILSDLADELMTVMDNQ